MIYANSLYDGVNDYSRIFLIKYLFNSQRIYLNNLMNHVFKIHVNSGLTIYSVM